MAVYSLISVLTFTTIIAVTQVFWAQPSQGKKSLKTSQFEKSVRFLHLDCGQSGQNRKKRIVGGMGQFE